jgi:uncharacterized protein (UPF0305 family)
VPSFPTNQAFPGAISVYRAPQMYFCTSSARQQSRCRILPLKIVAVQGIYLLARRRKLHISGSV